jgi:hypothetical protein
MHLGTALELNHRPSIATENKSQQRREKRKWKMTNLQLPTQERWELFRATTQRIWAGLSDDDYQAANGVREQLFAIIAHRFGDSREIIASKIDRHAMDQPISEDAPPKLNKTSLGTIQRSTGSKGIRRDF